jgi:coenzyme F420-0:L-glutamate ligase
MQVSPIKTTVFKENENLVDFVFKYIQKPKEGSVVAVTSKIVALAEGRTVVLKDKKQKERLIQQESQFSLKTKHAWLTIKDGMVMASAGIDESNAGDKMVLLPKDSFASAQAIRIALKKKFKLKNIGVLITDSRVFPLRAGVVGAALGYAGFKGGRNYIGKKDIFGKKLKITKTNIADCLATAAVLCMGEGSEQQPLGIINDAPVEFTEKVNKKELNIALKDDLYIPMLKNFKPNKK